MSRYQLERSNKTEEEEGEDETKKSPLNSLANGGSDGADRFRGVRREREVWVRVVRQKSPSRITVYLVATSTLLQPRAAFQVSGWEEG